MNIKHFICKYIIIAFKKNSQGYWGPSGKIGALCIHTYTHTHTHTHIHVTNILVAEFCPYGNYKMWS
jgi:hypothetical protein